MKFNNSVFLSIVSLAAMVIFTNCASLTGFQTGRTVGQNNGEALISLNASQTPKFDFDSNDSTEAKNFYFPNFELSGRYGIIERLDIGLRLNTNFNIALDARYQLVGNRESPVAVAVGFGTGTFGLFAGLWNIQLPLYFSIHPSQSIDIYIAPRYISQFVAGDFSGSLGYVGGNAGILIGKKTKFGFDAGYYKVSALRQDILPIPTFGIGVKIPFGNN